MALFDKKKSYQLDKNGIIPSHIAIIMDGNGRWAKKRMMPRIYGHKEGMNTVKKIALHADSLGVKVLTLYAFSTENWKRPDEEVSFLMNLPIDFFDVFMPELKANNIRVNVIGWEDQLPKHTKEKVMDAVDQTKNNTGMVLNFALNYGSRQEITQVVKAVAEKISNDELSVDEVTEEYISNALFTGDLGEMRDPELLIRTSGELRISNFLLWQIAYSELYFTDEFWPDFSAESLEKAVVDYQKRHPRYGGL
ncbi:isoprenyl transferase [Jeotgalibaca porci]|uniref:isoprenyl transferase n=1 Tax=Jeotgalibaca porci TaxID=1868793 RepID=UPI0035A046AE